jgi:hypothetical protein
MTTLRSYLSGLLGDAGTIPAAQAALDVIFGAGVTAKSGAYTLAASDRGQLLDCAGTWTLSLLAAATAGAGFCVALRNSGSGVITIDPDGAETVDGESTITIEEASSAILVCTGTGWVTVGLAAPIEYPISIANGGTGSGATPTVSNSPQADNIKAVKHDHGYNTVGSLCFASISSDGNASVAYSAGATISGNYLYAAYIQRQDSSWAIKGNIGGLLSGTWRILCAVPLANSDMRWRITLFQRIA